jgi:hypothetical protein
MKNYQISYSRLINAEFYQFLSLIAKSANDADPVLSKFKPEYDALVALQERLLAAINREKALELTAVLEKQDAERDKVISGFVSWINGLANHKRPAKSEPATTIQHYLANHGSGIADKNSQAETAILSKIVADFKSEPNLQNALAKLDGSDWIEDIEETNTAFMNTYAERNGQIGAKQIKETYFDIRKDAIPAYEALVGMILSRYKIAVADKSDITLLQKCVNEIDATLIQYRQLIKATQTNKKITPPEG